MNPPSHTDFPFVGAWDGHWPNGQLAGESSFVLIHECWALTARHVVTTKVERPNWDIRLRFVKGEERSVRYVVPHLRKGDRDIALVRLDSPVTTTVATLLQRPLVTENGVFNITVVGRPFRRKRAPTLASNRKAEADGIRLYHHKQDGFPGTKGDSGGAYLFGSAVAGIISGGTEYNGVKVSKAVQPAHFKGWIDEILAWDNCWATWG